MTVLPWHLEALQRLAARRDRLPHALLVQGRAGIGKTEFARALAKAVLCEKPREGLACGACESCHWFEQSNHPDYRELVPEAAEEDDEEVEAPKAAKAKSVVIKVDQIRAVADLVALTTHRGGYRVLVIRPAEALHPAAANALLKTLEEPPPASLIVLVSDQPARLLATIRSRCRRVSLATPSRDEALAWLRAQGIDEAERLLANAGGAPLAAQALAEPEHAAFRNRVLAELARPGGAEVLRFAAGIDRSSVERFIHWMQTWVHDLVSARLAGEVRHHPNEAQQLRTRARGADLEALLTLDRDLAQARRLASHPLNPQLVAEHLLMAYNRATTPHQP